MSSTSEASEPTGEREALLRLHLWFGWLVLTVFLVDGLLLETLHALKVDLYLNVANQTRRLMWTLAHAHGSLLGLINVAFAVTVATAREWRGSTRRLASRALLVATVLVPGGFFVGGLVVHSGDPGLGVLLVPPGGLLAIVAAALATLGARRLGRVPPGPSPGVPGSASP